MSFFDDHFPGVRRMLEDDSRVRRAAPHKPWCITGLELGQRAVLESFDTEAEAEARFTEIVGNRPRSHWTIADLDIERLGD